MGKNVLERGKSRLGVWGSPTPLEESQYHRLTYQPDNCFFTMCGDRLRRGVSELILSVNSEVISLSKP